MKRTKKSGGSDPAEKTAAILGAVRTVLARQGYASTTIAKVAAEMLATKAWFCIEQDANRTGSRTRRNRERA